MSKRLVSLSLILKHRAKRKTQHKNSRSWRLSRILLTSSAVLILLLIAAGITFAFLYARLTHDLPSLDVLSILLDPKDGQLLQPTRFYDRTGEYLLYTLENPGLERRMLVIDPTQTNSLSPNLLLAVVAARQPDFWNSPGYDLSKLTDPQPRTIAEKLACDLLLWREPPSSSKALRMRLLAAQLVRTYGRTQVLEWYLNSASFGHYAYGVEAAARLYLGKSAHTLSLAEAAFLAGLSQAPALNPIDVNTDPKEIAAPILQAMLDQGLITRVDRDQAVREVITLQLEEDAAQPPAYALLILSQLASQFPDGRLERGGLKVITTLDHDLQQQSECTLLAQLARLQIRSYDTSLADGTACLAERLLPTYAGLQDPLPSDLGASVVIIDPATGELLALVGDTKLDSSNATLHQHEPGSLLTPFVATTAFARGMSPATLAWDVPARIPAQVRSYFDPDAAFRGPMRLRNALVKDVLNPFAQLLEQFGSADVIRSLQAFGLAGQSSAFDPMLAIFEGNTVSPLSVASAYSAFATQGSITGIESSIGIAPVTSAVIFVQDVNDNVLWQSPEAVTVQVLSAPLAYMVHDILADRTALSTSDRANDPLDIDRPAGVKYGVVADKSQVWTVGYTPQRLTVVWLGLAAHQGDLQPQMAGGIWHALMTYAHQDLAVLGWNAPSGITRLDVCDPSGLLPTNLCPAVVEEIFTSGNEPLTYDDLYQSIQINRETNRLATVFTPINLVEEHVFLIVPDDVRSWAESAGLSIPPQQYDLIQYPRQDPNVQITSPSIFSYLGGKITVTGTAYGDDFLGYRVEIGQGINPLLWQLVDAGDLPVINGILAEWDTSDLNGLFAIRLEVLHANQYFDIATIQVTVDNTPPVAALTYPQEDQQLTFGQEVIFQASLSDEIGISRVEWWLDGTRIGARTLAPFNQAWSAVRGEHTLFIRVFDLAGNMTQSESVTFNVEP